MTAVERAWIKHQTDQSQTCICTSNQHNYRSILANKSKAFMHITTLCTSHLRTTKILRSI